jgi:hypothetical protein
MYTSVRDELQLSQIQVAVAPYPLHRYNACTGGELVSTGSFGGSDGVPRLIGWPRKKPVTQQLQKRSFLSRPNNHEPQKPLHLKVVSLDSQVRFATA